VVPVSVDVEEVRQRLLDERARVFEERERLVEDTSGLMEDLSEEDGVDSHPADSATETLSREIELSLEDNADRLLAAIDAALKRLDDGTYGVCESCGQNISPDRLEALPYATKCIECKRREERG
jgi:RNA polymerase-binding transcription factor